MRCDVDEPMSMPTLVRCECGSEGPSCSWPCDILIVRRLALLCVHVARALHRDAAVVHEKARVFFARVEMLVPREDGDHQRVARLPVVALILDDAIALAGKNVIRLLVDVPVRAGALAAGDLGDERAEHLHVEAEVPGGKR